jgi:hypothetical protein
MIKASTAATITQRKVKARELKAQRQRQREAAKLKATRERLAKTEVPFALKEVEKKIKTSPDRSTEWSFPAKPEWQTTLENFVKELEANGYKCRVDHDSGSADMGDFNAPCVVYYDNYIVTITW